MANPLTLQSIDSTVPTLQPDRRRHRRIELALAGRFMRENGNEFACRLKDISVGGAAILTEADVQPGENIVAYVDEIGRLEGPVFRRSTDGFVLTLRQTPRGRERLAAQLMWLTNKDELDSVDRRRPGHSRVAVGTKESVLVLRDNRAFPCTILDLSISGAAVETSVRPPIGAFLHLGHLDCQVIRYHDTGVAVAFSQIQDSAELGSMFGL
ncbi:MAG: PilZ domain-containing protein [Pseudomonadota bacterium]